MSVPPANTESMPCTVNDVDELSAVSAIAFIETFVEYYSTEDSDTPLRKAYAPGILAKGIASPGSTFCLARIDGETVGYAKINIGEAQDEDAIPDALEIERVYVLKRLKGHGLDRSMLERAFKEVRV